MRWLQFATVLMTAGLLLPSLPAQVVLKAKLPDKFVVELKSDYKRHFKSTKSETRDRAESAQVLQVAILKTNPDGSLVAELKIDSFKEAVTDEANKKKEGTHPELQDVAVQLTLDAGMIITKVDGIDAVLKKIDPQGKAKAVTKAYQQEYYENLFRFWAGEIFVPLPDKAVQTGAKWEQKTVRTLSAYGSLRLTRTLTYQGTEMVDGKELHKIRFTTAHAFAPLRSPDAFPFKVTRVSLNKMEYTGTMYFDAKSGQIVRADNKEIRDLVMTLAYDALNRDVRIDDAGTSSLRVGETKK